MCDFRVMNETKGFFCLNELDIGLVFTHQMNALITSKVTHAAVMRVMCGADRFSGKECLRLGIVDAVQPAEKVLVVAQELAKHYSVKGDNKTAYRKCKEQIYQSVDSPCLYTLPPQ